MNFNLSEEQLAFQNSVRSLAEKYLTKDNLKRAHDPLFPKDIAKLFAKNGLIQEHRDYFDFCGPTFGPVPILGPFIRWLYARFVS